MAKSTFSPNPAKIKVCGLGGGGCNAITRMVREQIQGVEFIARPCLLPKLPSGSSLVRSSPGAWAWAATMIWARRQPRRAVKR